MRKLPITWQYVAGFFDGEGHVRSVMRDGYLHRAEVSMSQSVKQDEVLDVIARFLKKEGIEVAWARQHDTKNPNAYPCRQMRISREEDVTKFLKLITPHLIVKREKAIEALKHLEARKRLRKQYGWNFRQLLGANA